MSVLCAAQVIFTSVFLFTIVIFLSIIRKRSAKNMVVKDVIGQGSYKSRGSARTRGSYLANTGNPLFRLKPKQLPLSQVVRRNLTREASSKVWKPPNDRIRSMVSSGKIDSPNRRSVMPRLYSSRTLPFNRRPIVANRAMQLQAHLSKYSKSSCIGSDFDTLQCEGTKSIVGRTRRRIDVLPQARQRKEFNVAGNQQYKLAPPECADNNPVPPLHFPTSYDAPECSFRKFSIPLPEHDPPRPYVFRGETRKPFCNGFATYRKPKEWKQNVIKSDNEVDLPLLMSSSSSSVCNIQRENLLPAEESLKEVPVSGGHYSLAETSDRVKGSLEIVLPHNGTSKDVGITAYDGNHSVRTKLSARLESAHPQKALCSNNAPSVQKQTVDLVNDINVPGCLKLTEGMALHKGNGSVGCHDVYKIPKTEKPEKESTPEKNPPMKIIVSIGETGSRKINEAIPASTGQYKLYQKSGPSLNTAEYSRAVPSKISIPLPTKTFSGLDIKEKKKVSKGIPASLGYYNMHKKGAETKPIRKCTLLDKADVSANSEFLSPQISGSVPLPKKTITGSEIGGKAGASVKQEKRRQTKFDASVIDNIDNADEFKGNKAGRQAFLTARRTGFDYSKMMESSGTSYVPLSGRIPTTQRSDRALFPLNIVSGICRGANGELESQQQKNMKDKGLPLIGRGNHWKQFPPPAASNRRLSSYQRLSRLSFMKKNESDYEVETSARGGAAASIPLYNSTPADLVVEGNTSIRNGNQSKENRWWQGDDSINQYLSPSLKSFSSANANLRHPSPMTPEFDSSLLTAESAKIHKSLERGESASAGLPPLFLKNRRVHPNSYTSIMKKAKAVKTFSYADPSADDSMPILKKKIIQLQGHQCGTIRRERIMQNQKMCKAKKKGTHLYHN